MAPSLFAPRENKITVYLSDPQLQHLGRAHFARNPLIRSFTDVADRNLVATQTSDLFIDESLRILRSQYGDQHLSLCILGDVPDTPCVSEFDRFERILARHHIPIDVYTRGNHSSANAFGIINMTSAFYQFLGRVPFFRHFSLRDEIVMAAGHADNILTARRTFEVMHRILHQEEPHGVPGIDALNIHVATADAESYQLVDEAERIPWDAAHRRRNFQEFWRSTKRTRLQDDGGTSYWECLVNAHVADQVVGERDTQVTPFYIQASEQARFKLSDGSELPVYNICLDGLDHNNFLALHPGISELQIRVVENFIERMLEDNPNARFKISCHFPARDLLRRPWRFWKGYHTRQALKKLLQREEVVLFVCGHAHQRAVGDLNQSLKLERKTPLTAIEVPSFIDYHPTSQKAPGDPPDARAVVVERMHVEESPSGPARLIIEAEFKGLDRREIVQGYSPAVHFAQKAYRAKHGYICARETMKDLRKKHIIGWIHSHMKRLWELFSIGLNPFEINRAADYWSRLSIATYVIDNFTVASTVNMFNEAFHLLSFLETIIYLIEMDGEPEEMAVKSQIEGLRTLLHEEYTPRRHEFENALSRGERPLALREYNDLFLRAAAHTLPELLMALKVGGKARAFALWAGIAASKEEFKYHGKEPSAVPKVIPPVTVPI